MKKWKPVFASTKFVEASAVFGDLPKAWDALCESSPGFTWGDNNRSLVDAETIRNHLRDVDMPEGSGDQIETAISRLDSLGQEYVDLEN